MKNGLKNIQTAGYNGTRTVSILKPFAFILSVMRFGRNSSNFMDGNKINSFKIEIALNPPLTPEMIASRMIPMTRTCLKQKLCAFCLEQSGAFNLI